MRQVVVASAKFAISAGLIWLALGRIDTPSAYALLRAIPAGAVAAAIAVLAFQLLMGGVRLHRLLTLARGPIGLTSAVDTVFVGAFFSQTFVSFIGGDAMRVWRLVTARVPVSIAFKAILLDRVAGFVGLIVVIVFGLPLLFRIITATAMRFGVLAAVAIGLLGTVTFLLMDRLPVFLRRWRMFRVAGDVCALARSISGRGSEIGYLVGVSVVIQVTNAGAIFLIASGLGVDAHFLDLLVLVPLVLLFAMLPISIAGWGVREGAMVVALGLVGVSAEHSVAISVCFGLSLILVGLPGGLIWLCVRSKN
ncbi:MAG: hypothetical protein A3G25_13490 [Betaproteobacteria bacterium RIFCSPLOWO2_12_FULL_63_13]|nr:MAG: hypothetical protein A3G25_13490 [Betaproteobacteria bacterium RIFCSPLOWO2_12_FULL_63_13]OGT79486.1 MAG: hypothetical protein A3H91_01650 [Gammaproteobacteria bacterium RIFCSPLOWO2_02_FULL_61_13]